MQCAHTITLNKTILKLLVKLFAFEQHKICTFRDCFYFVFLFRIFLVLKVVIVIIIKRLFRRYNKNEVVRGLSPGAGFNWEHYSPGPRATKAGQVRTK